MREIQSIEHATRNEYGQPQVTIEYEKTFLQTIFRKPQTIRTFVYNGETWINKETGQAPTNDEYFTILQMHNRRGTCLYAMGWGFYNTNRPWEG